MNKNTHQQRRKTTSERFWEKVEKTDLCWLWTSAACQPYGHGVFWLKGRNVYAHRLAFEFTHGQIPQGMFVCHKCDNPRCVNPDHLFLGTHQENMDDMMRKGRGRFPGAKSPTKRDQHPLAKLTELDVQRMRIVGDAVPLSFWKKVYGIGASAAWSVIRGKSWRGLGTRQALC